MKLNEKRVIEYVLLVLFPAALFAGCAGNGDEKSANIKASKATEMQYESAPYATTPLSESDSLALTGQFENPNSETTELVISSITPGAQSMAQNEQGDSLERENNSLERTLRFATNQYAVQLEDDALLAQFASKLLTDPSAYLNINGHADERGTEDYNLRLSERRAKEVEARLLSLGVPVSQLRVYHFGESKPVVSGGAWQENRRVELEYLGAKDSAKVADKNVMEDSIVLQMH